MKLSPEEQHQAIVNAIKIKITKSVTAGGESGYYEVVDPQKLAEFLASEGVLCK